MSVLKQNSSSVADLNTEVAIVYQAACSVNLILSVPTNGYVLWLIVTGAGETMTTDLFTLSLSVFELLFCLSSVFFLISDHIQALELRGIWLFGLGALFCGRPLFQTCICVERYLAVIHPVTFLKYKPLRYRVGFCSAAWLFIFGFSFFDMFMDGTLTNEFVWLILYIILLFLMLFCCLSVLWALKQPGPVEGGSKKEGANNMKIRAFRIISVGLVSMLISYLPVFVNMCLLSFTHILNVDGNKLYLSISLFIVVISGIVHPLHFLHRTGKLLSSLDNNCFRKLN